MPHLLAMDFYEPSRQCAQPQLCGAEWSFQQQTVFFARGLCPSVLEDDSERGFTVGRLQA
jgi:hypothetical protein